jgi:hypothetical protein
MCILYGFNRYALAAKRSILMELIRKVLFVEVLVGLNYGLLIPNELGKQLCVFADLGQI